MSNLLILVYPLTIWLIDRSGDHSSATFVLIVILAVISTLRFLRRDRVLLWLGIMAVLAAAMLLLPPRLPSEQRFYLLMPVATNAVFLAVFGHSLGPRRTPVIQRFAQVVHPGLSPERIAHCRRVTVAWCVFFAINSLVSLHLALFATVSAWTIYTGGVSYVLMGLMFAGEYTIRRIRFG